MYNLTAMKGGEIELAIVQSDWQEHAFNGTSDFAKIGRMEKLRFVMSLHNEAVTLVVQKKSPIAKFDDIQGKIVNIGPDGSGVKATMNEVFKTKGWSARDFKSLTDLKPGEQGKALCDGTIDVMVVTTGHPNGSVQDVANMCDVKIIDADDTDINKMVQSEPEFSEAVIPGGIYPGVPTDIKTFGVKAVLVTNADVSEAIIYSITKLVFENIDTFKTFHPVFAQLTPAKMATEGKTVPYHPGALKYYNEKGIVKP
jgi:TRAP transporter TAXI family solute receptor